MGLRVDYLSKQLNIPVEQLISKIKDFGIKTHIDEETELTEEELRELYHVMFETNDSEKFKKFMNYMDFIIGDSDIIFIDTSSLLQESSEQFLERLASLLKKHDKKLALPYKVYEEIEKHRQNTEKKELSRLAVKALNQLVQIQQDGYLEIYGDEAIDNFADNVFMTQISRLRIKYKVLLITNDIKLGQDILMFNQSQSVKGKNIHVQKVDRSGFLRRIRLNTEKNPSSFNKEESIKIPEDEKFKLATSLVAISHRLLPITKEVSEGDIVYTDQRTPVLLKETLGSGGEGYVYATDDEQIVAKIYKKEKLTLEKYEKLKLMVSKKIKCDGICYPISILYNDVNEFIGYTMPKAKGKELKNFLFIPKKVFQSRNPDWTRKDLVQLTITILEKIEFLHKRNIILGDINPFNILVVSPTEVYFVDVDSYQVEGFPCPVGTDNFTAPEIQGKNFKDFLRSFGNEYFAVATLIFSILFMGKSPYSQTGGDTNAENIKAMDFPYSYGREERAENTPKGQWRYIWSNLPYRVKEALYQTFQKGQPHSTEENRLTTSQWLSIMKKYYRDLDSGKLLKQDEMANEIFPNRFKMIGDSKKNLQNCSLCHKDYQKWQLTNGICRECLLKGEEYECARCGKELIFTNYEKYVRKMTKRFEYCKDCNTYYRSIYQYRICTDCGQQFEITYWQKEFYDSKGYSYPRRCADCRKYNRQRSRTVFHDFGWPGQSAGSPGSSTSGSSGRRGWCYLTTVACEYFELPDDCYELETLRFYRDHWLAGQSDGPALIEQYYAEAPAIVQWIKTSANYQQICEEIMRDYILPCVRLIEEQQYERCKDLYILLFTKLSKRQEEGMNNGKK